VVWLCLDEQLQWFPSETAACRQQRADSCGSRAGVDGSVVLALQTGRASLLPCNAGIAGSGQSLTRFRGLDFNCNCQTPMVLAKKNVSYWVVCLLS